ncbi:N-carbamoyl-L-amino-acid hydrolase [Pararhizobium capsulatum DSM 1112]|uniref:N-carbamoyl-L-amino-acid hydrolase n=1 Tax=Pararhizobium capsulatum DSM 1112 TaxID=1121113 RepID=A0ABU0C1R5_9HYPH|nr:Zn-dependent hydrolase [Pararhizobium capsulatum]MDQ0323889.1 N-carbamoyl-L-amino-acid hydrolase [Pararhizobium capsulatum DSM 1112]
MKMHKETTGPIVNADRIQGRIDKLSTFTDPDKPWSRIAFGENHRKARAWLTEEMRSLGMAVEIDAGGNLIGRLPGVSGNLPPLASGSHSDTVPDGGRFDGAAGVIVALEAISTLRDAGQRLRHPFEVIDFLAEEPNKYELSCIGSRAMAGELTDAQLSHRAADGTTLAEGIALMGGDPHKLGAPIRMKGEIKAFLEMHIEQGRVLESAGDDVGVVTAIVGITRMVFEVTGRADHSGTTPMGTRKDAMVGASAMIVGFESRALGEETAMVATVGKLQVLPNASNVVPGQVRFTLEIRSSSAEQLQRFAVWAQWHAGSIASERGLDLVCKVVGKSEPIEMDPAVQVAICDAAASHKFKYRSMPSGAGHDAAHVALLAPSGMIFIPCLDGRSHCPEEFASTDQMARGAQTLLDAILILDSNRH